MLFYLIDDRRIQNCIEFVKSLRPASGYAVEITTKKPKRSVRQNNTMWMWYQAISDHTGYDPEDLHNQMKIRVLGVEEKTYNGNTYVLPKSTTKLGTKEMADFLNAIEALAIELNIKLPIPDDYRFLMGEK